MVLNDFLINELNYKTCAMFLGGRLDKMPENIKDLMKKAEQEILKNAEPKAVYEIFDIKSITDNEFLKEVELAETDFKPKGHYICKHLLKSSKAILLCATIGSMVDRLIKKAQINDMVYAMVLDSMAGVMIETICDEAEKKLMEKYKPKKMTFRYGLGYGDLPIEQETEFLNILNASKEIGVCVSSGYLLTPCKSVACIIGLEY